MRIALLLGVFLLHGCTTVLDDEDYSDGSWSQASEDEIIEDAPVDEDVTEPPDDTDDTLDPTEVDDEDAPIVEADVASDGPTVTTIAAAGHYQNPVASSCADPGVIRVGGANGPTFYAVCTGNGFPRFRSKDLVHWTADGHIFSLSTKPAWAGGNYWAPEIHHIGDKFVAYYVALSPTRKKMCIGAARATSVEGPFHDVGHPLVCDSHVSLIDPNVFTDTNGRHYLYYKTDGNGLSPKEKTIIYGQQLRADGLGLVGARHRLLKNTLAWEGDVVEAPWVMRRGKYYELFYSGFRYCNQTYGVGIARSLSPLGPFHKRSAPILRSSGTWSGPGHNSVVATGGHNYIVYHAWHGAHQCGDPGHRELLLDRITWRGGWPFVNAGQPSRGVHTAPAVP